MSYLLPIVLVLLILFLIQSFYSTDDIFSTINANVINYFTQNYQNNTHDMNQQELNKQELNKQELNKQELNKQENYQENYQDNDINDLYHNIDEIPFIDSVHMSDDFLMTENTKEAINNALQYAPL